MIDKPTLANPVKGDVMPPYIYDGKDWIKYPSKEADDLSKSMAEEYNKRFKE